MLRQGPQSLPAQYVLLALAIVVGIIVDSISSSLIMPKYETLNLVGIIILYNGILLVTVYLLMLLIGYRARILQTLTAITGTGVLISLVLLPGIMMIVFGIQQNKSVALILLIDNIWRIIVNAHIFRHALSVGMLMSMILAVSYLLFGILVADFILPVDNR